MKLPKFTAELSLSRVGPRPSARRAETRVGTAGAAVVPAAISDTNGNPVTAGKAYDAVSGACGTVGAAFTAGRDIEIVPGTYGSTGWHSSKDMYPTSTGYLKVATTKANGTECTCHVFDAQTPSGCYAASCSCDGQGYKWQTS